LKRVVRIWNAEDCQWRIGMLAEVGFKLSQELMTGQGEETVT
jgi:hypothetical protein